VAVGAVALLQRRGGVRVVQEADGIGGQRFEGYDELRIVELARGVPRILVKTEKLKKISV